MDKEHLMQALIEAFLAINPDPPDEQFHMLARSIGMDPPALEAVAYKMLAEEDAAGGEMALSTAASLAKLCASFVATAASEEEDVLDGEYDPDTTTPDDLLLNDGEPVGSGDDDANQDALYTDGAGAEDFGIDVEGDQSVLYDDGAPAMQLQAGVRLGLKRK